MASEKESSSSVIGLLSQQLEQLTQRLNDLDSERAKQEGTIRIKQEESQAATQKIKVG